jgi:hypothetical protein
VNHEVERAATPAPLTLTARRLGRLEFTAGSGHAPTASKFANAGGVTGQPAQGSV